MIRYGWVEFVLDVVVRIRTLSWLPIEWKQVLMPAKLDTAKVATKVFSRT